MADETGPALLMKQMKQMICDNGLPCEGSFWLLPLAGALSMAAVLALQTGQV